MQLGHILRWPFISFGVGHWRERKCLALRCGSTLNGPLGCEESAWSECPGTLSEVSEGALTLWISGDVRKACFRQVRRVEGRWAAGRAGSRKVGIEGMEQTDLGQRPKGWKRCQCFEEELLGLGASLVAVMDFPGVSVGKESTWNLGHLGSIPESGEGTGN